MIRRKKASGKEGLLLRIVKYMGDKLEIIGYLEVPGTLVAQWTTPSGSRRKGRNNTMPSLKVENLTPGMILAKPLTKGNMVILGEGTVLTEAWIERIADMGIELIAIEGPSEQPVPMDEALEMLDLRFRSTLDKPYMSEIKEQVKKHIEGLYAG